MTREDYKANAICLGECECVTECEKSQDMTIDLIFNYFEAELNELKNRTCEECEFLTGKDKSSECSFGYLPNNLYEHDFCCNKWQSKEIK